MRTSIVIALALMGLLVLGGLASASGYYMDGYYANAYYGVGGHYAQSYYNYVSGWQYDVYYNNGWVDSYYRGLYTYW